MAAPRSSVTLAILVDTCERFFARDGFVKWSDVGEALGISRQAVQLRLKAEVERGNISPETVERWQSIASRRAATRERRRQGREAENAARRNTVTATLLPENVRWLRTEAALRRTTAEDIINGLITKARTAPPEDVREG